MQQQFKEGNLCWHCQYINKCKPLCRPQYECPCYKPLGRIITQQTISELLGISPKRVEYIISKLGVDKVIEMLNMRGYVVRYEHINEYTRFYKISTTQNRSKK